MREVIEVRNEIAKLSSELGGQEIQQMSTKRLREKVLSTKEHGELQKLILEVLAQDEVFHDENIKNIKERVVLLDEELKQIMKGE